MKACGLLLNNYLPCHKGVQKVTKGQPRFFPFAYVFYFIVIISPTEKFTTCFSSGKEYIMVTEGDLTWGSETVFSYLELV